MTNEAVDVLAISGDRAGGQPADDGDHSPDAAAVVEPTTNAALASRLLAVLQPASSELTTCPGCDGARLGRWGTTERGLRRWRCRACRRTCTAASGTPFAHLHSPDKLRQVAADMLADQPRSCRALAATLDLDRMTVWRWRRLIADAWAGLVATDEPLDTDPAAEHTATLRESRKASREWVRHRQNPTRYPEPDRWRWIDYRQQRRPLPEPMCRYRVQVALQRRACAYGPTIHDECCHSSRSPVGLPCCDRSRASIGDPSTAATSTQACLFQAFLAPFTGPATRHLRTYVAWFQARLVGTAQAPVA